MSDLVQLLILAAAVAAGVPLGGVLVVRRPRIVYHWMWVAFGGIVIAFVGLTLDGGEFLGGRMSPGDWVFIAGAVVIAAGLRIRLDAP